MTTSKAEIRSEATISRRPSPTVVHVAHFAAPEQRCGDDHMQPQSRERRLRSRAGGRLGSNNDASVILVQSRRHARVGLQVPEQVALARPDLARRILHELYASLRGMPASTSASSTRPE